MYHQQIDAADWDIFAEELKEASEKAWLTFLSSSRDFLPSAPISLTTNALSVWSVLYDIPRQYSIDWRRDYMFYPTFSGGYLVGIYAETDTSLCERIIEKYNIRVSIDK